MICLGSPTIVDLGHNGDEQVIKVLWHRTSVEAEEGTSGPLSPLEAYVIIPTIDLDGEDKPVKLTALPDDYKVTEKALFTTPTLADPPIVGAKLPTGDLEDRINGNRMMSRQTAREALTYVLGILIENSLDRDNFKERTHPWVYIFHRFSEYLWSLANGWENRCVRISAGVVKKNT